MLPFVSDCRTKLYSHAGSSAVPDDLTAVCWCDGANVQLSAITEESHQARDYTNKIITCKHSASRTSVEQACDRCPVFRSLKKISRSITNESVPHLGLKGLISRSLTREQKDCRLKLPTTKYNALVDFLSCYPTILSRAAPHDSTGAGFVSNGMLDDLTYCYPDLYKILQTCKTFKYTNEMEELVRSNFAELYEEQIRAGILSDNFMEGFGFLRDRDFNGNEIRRISECESWQRAKCLSCTYQRDLRKRKLDTYQDLRSTKASELQASLDVKHNDNIACTSRLLSVANPIAYPRPMECYPSLGGLTMDNFGECNMTMLKGFIYVREYKSIRDKSNPLFVWPKNRGSVESANMGQQNLISYAYKVRMNTIILAKSATLDNSTFIDGPTVDNMDISEIMPTVVEV